MQIAKLFAGLGFQVDTTGLVVFKKALTDARGEITNMSRGGKTATRQFRNLRKEVDKLSASMGKIKNAGGNKSVGGSYRDLAGDVWKVNNALNSIATNQPKTTKAIGKINASVISGLTHWNSYRRSIVQTRRTLANLNGDLSRLRANSRIDVRIRNTGGNAGAGGAGRGAGGAAAGLLGGVGLRGFLGNMMPTAALGSVGAAAGYGGVAVVKASREQTKMENAILMTSTGAEDFADTLQFVRSEALRLGITSTELGKSFSQMNLSAKGLTKNEKKEMFTGFSEFMVALGVDKYGQKGILKAYNQMFALGKISQEEINQLSEHGIPATLVYDAAMKAHNLDSIQAVKNLQEKGGLIPELVLKELSKDMGALANDTGALAKMMQSSGFKQNVMKEQFEQASKRIMDGGLDAQLGNLIGQFTKIIPHIENTVIALGAIITKIKEISSWVYEVSGTFRIWAASLLLVLFRFKSMTVALRVAISLIKRQAGAVRVLAAIFTGLFGKALGGIILRFGGWATAIYIVIKALSFLGDQISRGREGEWTFFDWMFHQFDMSIVKIKIFWAYFEIYKNYITGGNWASGVGDSIMNSGVEALEKLKQFKKDFHKRNGTTPLFTGHNQKATGAIENYNSRGNGADWIASSNSPKTPLVLNGVLITKNGYGSVISRDDFSTTAIVAGLGGYGA